MSETTTSEVLAKLLSAQGRTVRDGQAAAAAHIDSGDQHVAAMCPTGVGKSALAVAVSVARKGGIIAVNSNSLVSQYVAEAPEWSEALGVDIAAVVGSTHYWCRKASVDLRGLPQTAVDHVKETGSFIGAGVEKSVYKKYSLAALVSEEDELTGQRKSPCTKCEHKSTCPVWEARRAAAAADVVITNATMLGMALKGGAQWSTAMLRNVIVLDEADSCREPIASVLGHQITVNDDTAVDYESAMAVVRAWAGDDEAKKCVAARSFLAAKRIEEEAGRSIGFSQNDKGQIVFTILADLNAVFAERHVVAMSATLSQRNVDGLGLDTQVASFQGLDVSASTVTVQEDAPAWMWGQDGPPAEWVAHVANELTTAFRDGGRTLGLFQANKDLDAVIAALPADVRSAVLIYSGKTDRATAVKTYMANPDKHLLIGLVQGAGRGLNLPGELLRKVILSRVAKPNPPRGTDKAVWLEDTRASVTQSVGRAHRQAGDWGHVTVVGGFQGRNDIVKALTDLGWKIS